MKIGKQLTPWRRQLSALDETYHSNVNGFTLDVNISRLFIVKYDALKWNMCPYNVISKCYETAIPRVFSLMV